MNSGRPFIIGVGGDHSSIGKTTLASALIEYLLTAAPCNLFTKIPRIGAIKYTKEDSAPLVTDDKAVIQERGKDTARLAEAGAEKTVWIRSRVEDLKKCLKIALERLSGVDVVIIEGNSAVESATADIAIFIRDDSIPTMKPSAERLSGVADIIVHKGVSDCGNAASVFFKKLPDKVRKSEMKELIKLMEDIANKKNVAELLIRRSVDGKITCAEARKIAEEAGVHYNVVGKTANELKIKIKSCDLGCF